VLGVSNKFSLLSVEEFDFMDTPPPPSANVILDSFSLVKPKDEKGSLNVDSVSSSIYRDPESHLFIPIKLFDSQVAVETHSLVDGGATSLFIDKKFAEQNGFPLQRKKTPRSLFVIDGREIEGGKS
jgi:hypothetical protein